MANTITKKTTAEKATTEKVVTETSNDTDARIKAQEQEIAELKKMIGDLLASQKTAKPDVANADVAKSKKKNITIINLYPGGLTVKGNKFYHFAKQFDTYVCSETEARAIVLNMPNAAREGIFYITDAEFVEENDLDGAYESLLNDTQIRNILTLDANAVLVAYKNATDAQRKIIDGMIINGRLNGEEIDANILMKLGELTGQNYLEIQKMEQEG